MLVLSLIEAGLRVPALAAGVWLGDVRWGIGLYGLAGLVITTYWSAWVLRLSGATRQVVVAVLGPSLVAIALAGTLARRAVLLSFAYVGLAAVLVLSRRRGVLRLRRLVAAWLGRAPGLPARPALACPGDAGRCSRAACRGAAMATLVRLRRLDRGRRCWPCERTRLLRPCRDHSTGLGAARVGGHPAAPRRRSTTIAATWWRWPTPSAGGGHRRRLASWPARARGEARDRDQRPQGHLAPPADATLG
jgi:hypothetical protein